MTLLKYRPIRYYCIGSASLAIDLCIFQIILLLGGTPVIAAVCSYAVAGVFHFTMNRIWTFKAFHRRAVLQVPAYGLVVATAWVITVCVVAWCTGVLHLNPLLAKFIAIGFTLPVGFFGHKYLTYGSGIIASAQAVSAQLAALVRSAEHYRE